MLTIKKIRFIPSGELIRKSEKTAERIGKKFGAYVMTTARKSIRSAKKKTSDPGTPPRSKTGTLKRFILFAWEPGTRSVIIGPKLLGSVKSEDAPEGLEKGGTTTRITTRGRIRQRVSARPFMVPALEERLPELPGLWKDAIK